MKTAALGGFVKQKDDVFILLILLILLQCSSSSAAHGMDLCPRVVRPAN